MKINDLYLILLLIIFIILSIFYIISVCNYNIKELFLVEVVDDNNVKNAMNCVFEENDFNNCIGGLETCKYSDMYLTEGTAPRYHQEYSCKNIKDKYIGFDLSMDNLNLLLTYSCVKLSPTQIKQYVSTNINVETILLEKYFNVIKESEDENLTYYIRDEITKYIKANTGIDNNSKFPIYACISQAPYLKEGNESTIVWDHNRGQPVDYYKLGCSIGILNEDVNACPKTHKMFIQILLIFFKNDCTKINKFIEYINSDSNKSKSLQCNINCGNAERVDGLACGCLNKSGSYDEGRYNSVCKTGNSNVDYSVIYYVNPHYHNFRDDFNKTLELCPR